MPFNHSDENGCDQKNSIVLTNYYIRYWSNCSLVYISGFMVKSERGHVRSFAVEEDDLANITLRTNERYDLLLELKQRNDTNMQNFKNRSKKERQEIEDQNKKKEKGVKGICVLRSLLSFDVGISFMADSLHNVYSGCFVRA